MQGLVNAIAMMVMLILVKIIDSSYAMHVNILYQVVTHVKQHLFV